MTVVFHDKRLYKLKGEWVSQNYDHQQKALRMLKRSNGKIDKIKFFIPNQSRHALLRAQANVIERIGLVSGYQVPREVCYPSHH